MEETKTVEAELEGGGSTWWYVCGECHGAVKDGTEVCPHCGSRLSWEGLTRRFEGLRGGRRNYTGEQTEPAE